MRTHPYEDASAVHPQCRTKTHLYEDALVLYEGAPAQEKVVVRGPSASSYDDWPVPGRARTRTPS